MKKYCIAFFLFLTSVTPTTNSAQNSENESKNEPQTSEIELMVDSLYIKKEEIIKKTDVIDKLEAELEHLNKKKRRKERREERKLKEDFEKVDKLMQRKEIY